MNNNEAKRVILEVDSCFCKHGAYKDCHSGCKYCEALDAAVKALEQEPFIYKPCVSEKVCEHDKNVVLDKIRDQLKSNLRVVEIALEVLVENDPLRPKMEGAKSTLEDCLELIDKAETEDT